MAASFPYNCTLLSFVKKEIDLFLLFTKEVKNFDDLQKIVGLTNIGETLTVKVIRDGITKDIPVRIKRGI